MSRLIILQETVERVVKETRNMPDIDVQRALNKAAPFHPGQIALWKKYGEEIYRQTKRKMYGFKYVQDKVLP